MEQFLAFLARLLGDGDPLTAPELAEFQTLAAEHASDEQLADIDQACREMGADDSVPLDAVRAAVALAETVRTEAGVRIETAEAELAEREALRAQLAGEPVAEDPEPEPDPEEVEDPEPDPEPEPEVTPDPVVVEVEVPTAITPEPELVGATAAPAAPVTRTAVARPAGAVAHRRPAGAPAPRPQRAANRIVRDGGGEYGNLREVGEAMFHRRQSFMDTQPGVVENLQIAKILADYPEERRLDGYNGAKNAETFARILSEMGGDPGITAGALDAVTASGTGFCAPAMPLYGIPRISTGDRPIRDSLIGFHAVRGAITYRPPSDIADFGGAITQWTNANDQTPGSAGRATKRCLTVSCLAQETATLYAVVQCLQFDNFMALADPESVDDATNKTLDAHAREAERLLLDGLKAASTLLEGGQMLGAFRDLLYEWGVTATGYRSRRRMRPDAVLELRAPSWVRDMIREDVARSLHAYPDQFAIADDFINRALAVRNIRPFWYIDSPNVNGVANNVNQIFGPQNAGSIVDFPEHVQWQMAPPGTFLYIENGELNLGVTRDSTLNGTNNYQTFGENFEGLAHPGFQSIWGISNVCANGASAGTTSPDSLCTSAGSYVPIGSGIGGFVAP